MRNRILFVLAIIIGVLLWGGTSLAETLTDQEDLGEINPQVFEMVGMGYLEGDTSVSIDWNPGAFFWKQYDVFWIWFETASDVWAVSTPAYTYKDSNSDGVYEYIEFTATGGATAGGKYWIVGLRFEGI
jgi:hypothetical protein